MIAQSNGVMMEALTPLWQRVLNRPQIRQDDDFFDQGGDAFLAAELLAQIEQVVGRHLPPTTICQAPTIRALSTLLEKPPAPSPWPLVLLKPGSEGPPIFIAHGVGGSIIDFVPLARRIQGKQPIFGLQVLGIDGGEEPLERVEEIAQYYLEAVKRMQPTGPYFLIGYSLGGQIMLEMAQRMIANDDSVSLLAMLDSYPCAANLPPRQRIATYLKWERDRFRTLIQLSARELVSKLVHSVGSKALSKNRRSLKPHIRRSIESANRAWSSYKPQFYSGRIDFIRANSAALHSADAEAIWGRLASEFVCETVPGDHVGMITDHLDSLAAELSRRVQAALARHREISVMDEPRPRLQRGA